MRTPGWVWVVVVAGLLIWAGYSYLRYGFEGPPKKVNDEGEEVDSLGAKLGEAAREEIGIWAGCLLVVLVAIGLMIIVGAIAD